jgi:hypothetical protein
MTAGVVDNTLGELLSPSQVNTFLSCPAKWYFRYALGLREPPTGALALGTAFIWRRYKLPGRRQKPSGNLPTEPPGFLCRSLVIAAEDAEFREDEQPSALIETGARSS